MSNTIKEIPPGIIQFRTDVGNIHTIDTGRYEQLCADFLNAGCAVHAINDSNKKRWTCNQYVDDELGSIDYLEWQNGKWFAAFKDSGYYLQVETLPTQPPAQKEAYQSVNTSTSENVKALDRKHSKEFEKILEDKPQSSNDGGVREEDDNAYTHEWLLINNAHYRQGWNAHIQSQPSPSNPSIKRPTEESFVEYIKKTRGEFSRECQINDWWYSLSAARRVSIEDLLIAYDQMAERLLSIQPDK